MQQPVITTEQAIVDREQLRLLSLFHYVAGGVGAFTSLIFLAYLIFGLAMVAASSSDARIGGWFFTVMFSSIFMCTAAHAGLMVYSGKCIAQRKAKTFSLVMAGLSCLSFPYGTILGVCTIMVLLRASVRNLYEQSRLLPAGARNAMLPVGSPAMPPPLPAHPFGAHELHHDSAEEQMWKELERRAQGAGGQTETPPSTSSSNQSS